MPDQHCFGYLFENIRYSSGNKIKYLLKDSLFEC